MAELAMGPILVTGMHRSGTTLLTRHLIQCGVYMGRRREHNEEATFFLGLNRRMFKDADASWDRPERVRALMSDPASVALWSRRCERAWDSWRSLSYRGFRSGRVETASAWGFKDPRTVFTAHVWDRVFPLSRIVFLVRNGVDVASSLKHREIGRSGPRWTSRFASDRCLRLGGALDLWGEYMEAGLDLEARWADRFHVVRYEDYVQRPSAELHRLLDQLGLAVGKDTVRQIVADTRSRGGEQDLSAPPHDFVGQASSTALLRRFGYAPAGGEPASRSVPAQDGSA